MSRTDQKVAEYLTKIEERSAFQDQLIVEAQRAGRDLSDEEMKQWSDAGADIVQLNERAKVMQDGLRIAEDSVRTKEAIWRSTNGPRPYAPIEYRSAGAYVIDLYHGAMGDEAARERMALYNRAAAHQTTVDNLGVIPEPVAGSVINFVDASRPIVNVLGPIPAPGMRFSRPQVTQRTDTAKQTGEKAELTSQKMTINRVSVTMDTYGGYVNVSRQDIDFSSPQIMDIVIADLAANYAQDTETATAVAMKAAATAQTPALTASSTAAEVSAAVWKAAGTIYGVAKGTGQLILAASPDMMGAIGPIFPSVSPTNAQSTGFTAGAAGGPQGSIAGVQVVMSPGLAAGTILEFSTSAAEAYEQRIGSLQVTEPSVLGVQVAYAGYFKEVVLAAGAIIKLTA